MNILSSYCGLVDAKELLKKIYLYPLLLTGLLALPPILPRDIDLWLITGEALAEFPLLTCWQGDLLKGTDNNFPIMLLQFPYTWTSLQRRPCPTKVFVTSTYFPRKSLQTFDKRLEGYILCFFSALKSLLSSRGQKCNRGAQEMNLFTTMAEL